MTWMPSTANSARTRYSPFRSSRRSRYSREYMSVTAAAPYAKSFSTVPIGSATKCPPRSSVRASTATSTETQAAPASAAMASMKTTARARGPAMASTSSSTQAASATKISAAAGAISASVRTMGTASIAGTSELARRQLLDQQAERRPHDVEQRRRPHAERDHRGGKHGEHGELARIQILERRHAVVGHVAPDHALDQPEGVGGTEDQRERGDEGVPEVGLEGGNDHEELAHEA